MSEKHSFIKKTVFILLMAAILLSLSGCVRMRATITVRKDGKFDLNMISAVSKSLSQMSDEIPDLGSLDLEEYEEDGYVAVPYEEDDYVGYIITKEDVDDLSDGVLGQACRYIKTGSKYKLEFDWDMDEAGSGASSIASAKSFISMGNGFTELIIRLPYKPLSHNATGVSEDGRTLTWNLLEMGDRKSIFVEYTLTSPGKTVKDWIIIGLIVLGGIALIAAAVIVTVKIVKSRRNGLPASGECEADSFRESNETESNETVGRTAEKDEFYEIREYKKLLDEGIITQDEFESKKKEILKMGEEITENGDSQV